MLKESGLHFWILTIGGHVRSLKGSVRKWTPRLRPGFFTPKNSGTAPGKFTIRGKSTKNRRVTFTRRLWGCAASAFQRAVIHTSVFERVGRFDEDLPACEDYDFWLRATHAFDVTLIPEYLTLKDGGRKDQLSMSIWGLDRFPHSGTQKDAALGPPQ